MIAYLDGKVFSKDGSEVVIGVFGSMSSGSVGYRVTCTPAVLSHAHVGAMVQVKIRQIVKEDSHDLYGFDEPAEEALFMDLISVPQVGAKMAMKILGAMSWLRVRELIGDLQPSALTVIKGVGPKVAQRIVDKLGRKAK